MPARVAGTGLRYQTSSRKTVQSQMEYRTSPRKTGQLHLEYQTIPRKTAQQQMEYQTGQLKEAQSQMEYRSGPRKTVQHQVGDTTNSNRSNGVMTTPPSPPVAIDQQALTREYILTYADMSFGTQFHGYITAD